MKRRRGVFHEVLEHLGCCVDEHLKERWVGSPSVTHTLDVGECSLFGVGDTCFGHYMVVGKPNPAA